VEVRDAYVDVIGRGSGRDDLVELVAPAIVLAVGREVTSKTRSAKRHEFRDRERAPITTRDRRTGRQTHRVRSEPAVHNVGLAAPTATFS
jgi:hypothetical protein